MLDADGGNPASIALGPQPEPDLVRRGEIAFHDADLCFQRWLSCATCHPGARTESITLDLGLGVTMQFIQVPGGRLNGTEVPPFWIGKTEVTNAQFRRFKTAHDSRDESRHGYQFGRRGYDMNGERQPAVRVSWNDASAFTRWLGETHRASAALPDGIQWEWACRAGATTAFPFGDVDADYSKHANLGDQRLRESAACTARANYHKAEPVTNPNKYDDWIPRDDRFDDGGFDSAARLTFPASAAPGIPGSP